MPFAGRANQYDVGFAEKRARCRAGWESGVLEIEGAPTGEHVARVRAGNLKAHVAIADVDEGVRNAAQRVLGVARDGFAHRAGSGQKPFVRSEPQRHAFAGDPAAVDRTGEVETRGIPPLLRKPFGDAQRESSTRFEPRDHDRNTGLQIFTGVKPSGVVTYTV